MSGERGVNLDDLAPEERRRLAQEAAWHEAADRVRRRHERMAALLPEREHMVGCPVSLAGSGELEAFAARRPPETTELGAIVDPAREVTVIRCITCGGQTVIDRPYQQVIEQEADR